MLEYALAAHNAGLCVMPPKGNGSKAPLGEWANYQIERSSVEDIHSWYGDNKRTGIGAILGKTSKNVELLEFDDLETYNAYVELAIYAGMESLISRVERGYCETTPNGVHWLYRCDVVEGNQKLAQRPKTDEEKEHSRDTTKALIETRGEGGYVVLAPTHGAVHPTGKPYLMRSGSYGTIETITPEERQQLFNLARSFDKMPIHEMSVSTSAPHLPGDPERPGDYFNRTRVWQDVLEPHGWQIAFTRGVETYWTRPGKERGISATTNYAESDLLKIFSTSTEFDTSRTYSKFGAHTLLNFKGSFADAARAIRSEMPKPAPTTPLHNLVLTDALDSPASGKTAIETPSGEVATQPHGIPQNTAQYDRLKARLFSTEELYKLPPPEWLIEGVLQKNSLAVLWGQSGTYKSFLAIDWACSVASGAWWKNRPIGDPQDVLYVAAEGSSGVSLRVKAWSKENNIRGLEKMHWLPEAVDLLNDAMFDALCLIVSETKPAFMIIDTLARSMPGADESGAKDMGIMIHRADLLKQISGATVLLIHHSTKEGSTARGSGALRAAVDTEMEVKADGRAMVTYCRKQKDAPEFDPIPLHLVNIDDSCVLSTVSRGHETQHPVSHGHETTKKLFRETFSETGVSASELRTVVMEQLRCSRATAYRHINELVELGFISNKATGRYPYYEKGENYYSESLSHCLTGVSSSLTGSFPVSHTSPPSLEGEGETKPETTPEIKAVQEELWR